ncbi:hybrid sensor histidine kinase/response regulator [Mangrovicoccus ximenensis]|uniref:hybrid sensor histidine kinase/response regulator n=1 Tax=Mangrovicoccus ximenensis TaxID=1911570 RepID=UPI001F46FD15|nr:hybrid sensor histidine kinase/response regulator [Mangrovicoccus ximenensis]
MDHPSLINPQDPPELQVEKQARIIDALLRRTERQHTVGQSAYAAFQSAVTLQEQVWAKTRDLERASTELEQLRFDREKSRKTLTEALSVMEGGFALFTDGQLDICNDLFETLLPDVSHRIRAGLTVAEYFDALRGSGHVLNHDGRTREALARARDMPRGQTVNTFVVGLIGDRWYQFSLQRTSSDNQIILQTDISDIVRRARREKDHLIDMHAHYMQAAFDHMSSGLGTFSREGALLIHNDRFRDLLGLPVRLVQSGTCFAEILDFIRTSYDIHVEDLLDFSNWRQVLRDEGRIRKRLRHPSGRVLGLHVHQLPDRGFLADIADITLEVQATELLERRVEERTAELTAAHQALLEQHEHQAKVKEELKHAKELAEEAVTSKTRFLAAASHDLLQPANAAKLLLSSLAEKARDSELIGMVERLQGSFASMESLLQAILDISRLDSTGADLNASPVCLGPLMSSVVEDQLPLAAQKRVKLSVVPSSAWVMSDQRYLLRSIQNLVVNAIQYTAEGRVLLGCRQRGGETVLEVWDTGMGISPEDQQKIFEEFTRAGGAKAGPGMGLGLSIVDRTCRLLGHRLSVRSTPGVGSVFSIALPRIDAPRETQPAPMACPDLPGEELDLLVLVIENDPDLLFATVQVLESWGASVFGTCSAEEALAVTADIGIPPDLILADYHLDDGATGVDAISAVRRATGASIPAIMVTADRSTELLWTARSMGAEVLTKPVDLHKLRRRIAAAMRGRDVFSAMTAS